MSAASTARQERVRAETAMRLHIKTCLDCYRWSKGDQSPAVICDLGQQLFEYVELMRQQEQLIPPPDEMIQDALF